jgi:GNAT superfamily N-acetyltransferase
MKIVLQKVNSAMQILAIVRLAQEIWTQHYTPILAPNQVPYMLAKFQSLSAITNQIEQGHFYFLIFKTDQQKEAEEMQNPIGYLAFNIENEICFLSKIYILDSARGQGYGKDALHFIEEEAQKAGANSMNLTVNKFNQTAQAAYLKFGFLNVGPIQTEIGNGYIMDDFMLVKQI